MIKTSALVNPQLTGEDTIEIKEPDCFIYNIEIY